MHKSDYEYQKIDVKLTEKSPDFLTVLILSLKAHIGSDKIGSLPGNQNRKSNQ